MDTITEPNPSSGGTDGAPSNFQPTREAPIVVAVDGGRESRRALRWALRRADQLGCAVRVVTTFQPPHVASEAGPAVVRLFEQAEASARERARSVIASVAPGRELDHEVQIGDAAAVLADESHSARMIVVGTRRRERAWHRLRPSLTNRLTGLAACPVVSIGGGDVEP